MNKTFKRAISAAASCVIALSCGGLSAFADIAPNPLISRNCPAYSGANPATASAGNDEHYFSFWFGTAPDYLAYDLSGVPAEQKKQVIAVWYNTSSYDVIGSYVSRNMEPSDYTIEVNAAEGGAYPEDGWVVMETVTDNTHGSRQHLIDMDGYNWIRMNITKADGKEGGSVSINFDIHCASEGVSDSWIIYGDSITAGGMNNCYGKGFASYINEMDNRYFPVQENGGIGGLRSGDGRDNIDRWLSEFPGKYVGIAYGTNDAWGGGVDPAVYYDNTKYMIDAVLAAGKVPIIPTIPYASNPDVGNNLPKYNDKIRQLYEEYGDKIVKGPDLEAFFMENADSCLSGDGVHPNEEGYDNLRRIWAEAMYENVYTAESSGTTEPPTDKTPAYGDANCDGTVDIADAVLIMQALSNPNRFGLNGSDENHITDEGWANADCSGGGDGVTTSDALAIQNYLVGVTEELPE